jgi:iron-sulfur cluster assembly protein
MMMSTNPATAPVETPMPAITGIEITAAAAGEIAKQRDKRGTPGAAIRVGIRGGGCTGFTYVFEWADEPRPTDKVFTAHGVTVVTDPKSFVYLRGMELDFVRGMMGHGFKFNNPNAKGACGCGESVQF